MNKSNALRHWAIIATVWTFYWNNNKMDSLATIITRIHIRTDQIKNNYQEELINIFIIKKQWYCYSSLFAFFFFFFSFLFFFNTTLGLCIVMTWIINSLIQYNVLFCKEYDRLWKYFKAPNCCFTANRTSTSGTKARKLWMTVVQRPLECSSIYFSGDN